MSTFHQPVLLIEVLDLIAGDMSGGWIADGTLGGGGHAAGLLERTPESVRLLCVDRDPQALEAARARLAPYGKRATVVAGRFSRLPEIMAAHGIPALGGLLLDLGVSSAQLDRPERGFSLRADGPLDMDMEARGGQRALDLLREMSTGALAEALRELGDVPRPGTVARVILEAVRASRVSSTADLAALVQREFPWLRKGGRHPATRIFQVIRVLVNDELGELQRTLAALPTLLAPGGRAAIISYHSAEDRAVKHAFRQLQRSGLGTVLTRKPVSPGDEERRANRRARSAKLRAFERCTA